MKKNFLQTGSPHLSKGLDDRAPPLSQGLDPALRNLLLQPSNPDLLKGIYYPSLFKTRVLSMTLIHFISLTELSIGHHRIRYFNENC